MQHRHRLILGLAALALWGAATQALSGPGRLHAACDGGGDCRCEVCGCAECCVVPDVKTVRKWVYASKYVPYCRSKCPHPFRHDSCSTCPECEDCVRYKRVLVKRAVITKKTTYKCVPVCEACRSRAAAGAPPARTGPTAGMPVAQPGEPFTAPPSTAPAAIE